MIIQYIQYHATKELDEKRKELNVKSHNKIWNMVASYHITPYNSIPPPNNTYGQSLWCISNLYHAAYRFPIIIYQFPINALQTTNHQVPEIRPPKGGFCAGGHVPEALIEQRGLGRRLHHPHQTHLCIMYHIPHIIHHISYTIYIMLSACVNDM